MPNTNRVRDGGFERSNTLAPFWTGTGDVEADEGQSLYGLNNGDIDTGEFISQDLRPLEVGKVYEFKAAIFFDGLVAPTTGSVDIDISGNATRSISATLTKLGVASNGYVFFSFEFTAKVATSTLTITNNTDQDLDIDAISIYKK